MTISEANRKFDLLEDNWARGLAVSPEAHSQECINLERKLHLLNDNPHQDSVDFLRREMRAHIRVVWGCEGRSIPADIQAWLLTSDHGDKE